MVTDHGDEPTVDGTSDRRATPGRACESTGADAGAGTVRPEVDRDYGENDLQ